jgi:coenzyme F420-reducing hydrogenase beta subunit
LENFRGSKYVQSYIGYSYRECLQKLRAGKKLLYFGTPCQIAGLENFLGNTDKSNLVTIDLICLGVPPFSYLKEYADFVTNNSWDNIEFRGKYGWNFTALNGGKIEYQRRHNYDLYYRPFSEALIFRDCCYQCEYSCSERCSDITIGDFWGLDKSTLNSSFKGEKISLVLLNTEKGKAFFEKSKSELTYEYRDLSEAIHPNQLALNHPAQPHNDREIFLENYTKLGYYSAVSKTHLAKNIKKDYFIFKIMDCKLVRLLRKIKRIVIK